jgi:PAS domain S-box-containing protein
MSAADGKPISRWISIPFSLLVLGVCLFYTYGSVYVAPYPGFGWRTGNEVSSIDPCRARRALCEANRDVLQIGDEIVAVDGRDFDKYSHNLYVIPFGEYRPGDSASIMILRDGRQRTVDWLIVGPSAASRADRLFFLLLFFVPFWLNGTLILFFLGPRSRSRFVCLLMAWFNYATAIWLTTGAYAATHVMYNVFVEHALSWLLVPIYLHFHLIAPSSLIRHRGRYALGLLYAIAAIFALLELFQVLPVTAFSLPILLAFISSLGVLIFRLVFNPRREDRRAVILMLVGITISLGPGIFLSIVPILLQIPLPMNLASIVSALAVPLLSFFYVYAVFKRYLGSLEARFRRGLGLYSFALLYATTVAAVFYLGNHLLSSIEGRGIFAAAAMAVFGVALVPLYHLFQKSFGRLVYGVTYDLSDMLYAFFTQVQAVVGGRRWMRVLADELDSRLLIRQSALCLLTNGEPELVYTHDVDSGEMLAACQNAQQVLADAGRYRPISEEVEDELGWVRLAIPLRIRGNTIGVWLFGRRDPDSFYSEDDVELLTALADQAAVIVENDRLYNKALEEIAERAQMEEALRESEEKLRAILNATTESVILVDDEGVILSLNRTAAQRLDLEVDAIVGLRGSDLVARGVLSTKLLDSRLTSIDQVFRSGKPVQFEDERDGTIYDTNVYPIFDADGRVKRVAIFARDVTARRQAEQQTIQVERLAAMGQVAGTLAHQINNPLQAIRSTLEMLVDFDLGSEQSREHLSVAIEEIQYLARVTHGVLEFTQSAQEDFRRVSAAELMQKALTLANDQLESLGIQVVPSFPTRPVSILAAPNQMVQVLFSLIAKAVEAMPRGGHLDVAVRTGGGRATLSISGSGTFVPDQVERLFDPFFAEEMGDDGLGLWISRGIIERHRGTISIQNLEDDRGVMFTVSLPLYLQPGDA